MRPYGKVNLIGVAILGALAYGLWWLITIGPAHLDNLDVKQSVDEALNQAVLGKQDEQLASHIIQVTSRVGEHRADDGYGTITTQPGLGLTRDDITIVRDEVHNTISIRVEYDRIRQLKPLNKERTVHFVIEKEGALNQ